MHRLGNWAKLVCRLALAMGDNQKRERAKDLRVSSIARLLFWLGSKNWAVSNWRG